MAKRLYIQLYNAKEGESITLPISPESIDLTLENDIQTKNILGFGEAPVRGYRTLQRINLNGLLPEQDTILATLASMLRFLEYKPYSLSESNAMLDRWVESGDVVRLIVSEKMNKEFLVERKTSTVREYTPDEQYSYDLIEYRMPQPKTQILPNNLGQSKLVQLKERTINKYIPSQLTGKAGQTIYKLAKLTYGGKFRELMDRNGITDANMDIAGKTIEMLPI